MHPVRIRQRVVARGLGLGVAQEAALKLKETCLVHAEALSAAELRHGPMALIRPGFPVLMFAQDDETLSGVLDLAGELAGRGARARFERHRTVDLAARRKNPGHAGAEMTTPALIGKLVKAGVVVSAGHTNATYADIAEALQHGLTGFTHLFNAMSQLTGREPGAVGAALDDANSWCGIIVDGQHTSPEVLRIALRIARGYRANLVLATEQLEVLDSWIDGRSVAQSA